MADLEVRELTVRFGGLAALDGVTLEVRQGEIVGLIGPNGAGKTTLLNAISRLCDVASGQIVFDGVNLLRCRPHEVIRHGIARTFQGAEIFPTLNVVDHLLVGLHRDQRVSPVASMMWWPSARREERWMRQQVEEVLTLLGLREVAGVPAAALPFALRKRVDLGRALVSRPRLLLLDEPAAGLTPEESQRLADLLRQVHQTFGCGIVLVEHDMSLVMDVCQRIVVLDFGRVIASGPPEAVRRDPAVVEAYLGEPAHA